MVRFQFHTIAVREVLEDPDNVAVIASQDDPEFGSAACFYFDWYIQRGNGDLIRFRVDLSD